LRAAVILADDFGLRNLLGARKHSEQLLQEDNQEVHRSADLKAGSRYLQPIQSQTR
jgi:hypothetical protein